MPPLYPDDPLWAARQGGWRWLDVALACADVAGQPWVLALVALALYSWLEREVRGVAKAFLPLAGALAAAAGLALLSRSALATARPVEAAAGVGSLLRHALPDGQGAALAAFAAYSLLVYGRRGRGALAIAGALAAARALAGPHRAAELAGGAAAGVFLGLAAYHAALRLFPGGHLSALRAARRGEGGEPLARASPPSA